MIHKQCLASGTWEIRSYYSFSTRGVCCAEKCDLYELNRFGVSVDVYLTKSYFYTVCVFSNFTCHFKTNVKKIGKVGSKVGKVMKVLGSIL